jgi:hypothetical protein
MNPVKPEPGVNKMSVADSCILATVVVVFGAMLVVTYKVFKIVRFGDKKMLLMLIFLDITLLGKLKSYLTIFIAKIIFYIIRLLLKFSETFNISLSVNLLITLMPVYMFSIAVTFNITKW